MKRFFRQLPSVAATRYLSTKRTTRLLQANPDLTYLLNPVNRNAIAENLVARLCVKDTKEAFKMLDDLQSLKKSTLSVPSSENRSAMNQAALEFPNVSHPDIAGLTEPKTLFDNTKELDLYNLEKIRSFDQISRILFGSRTDNTGEATTEKSYYLLGPLAELEQALIHYTVDNLVKMGFTLVSVPDILDPEIIEACGLKTTGKITNVFQLDDSERKKEALSGTAEMAFGAMLANRALDFSSPVKKFAAVSRCYRAESTMGRRERGLYRVHHFTKVEMFAVTINDTNVSNLVHQQFLTIQQKLFDNLNLFYRVLDMHPGDLGAPATRKFDCEALLPGYLDQEPFYGEISSTSNCLDYQSRRLNIRMAGTNRFCHTVNGTACAVPRMIMAMCEQNQLANGCVSLPAQLERYLPSLRKSKDPFLGPRPKKQRPLFVYKSSPKAFIQHYEK